MTESERITRRRFQQIAGAALAGTAAAVGQGGNRAAGAGPLSQPASLAGKPDVPIKCFCCDFNWSITDGVNPSAAYDWAFVDPQQYFDWHRDIGNNVAFCQAYTFGGYAFYPTRLGPVAPGPGSQMLPRLYDLSRKAGMPFMSYFCVGADLVMSNHRPGWVLPNSRNVAPYGFLGPETPWTDLFCRRVREFLRQFPVEWLLFDWFIYGTLHPNEAVVYPAPFVAKPFQEIIGRPMPKTAAEITAEQMLKYKREVLARQFRAIRDAVRQSSPNTRIGFNVPYEKPDEALWRDHPMLNESDFLFAECTGEKVMEWALAVRKPRQRVFTTIIGYNSDPNSWRKWHARGCDFFGYAFGVPPDFRPAPAYERNMKIVRAAFKEMS